MSRKMNSFLIIGGSYSDRLEKIKEVSQKSQLENQPDQLVVQAAPSVGINQVRQLKKFLSRKRYQASVKTVIIPQAEKLTRPAQNALLKTLEEPPVASQLFLSCPNENQLLATILSRCQIIKLPARSSKITPSLAKEYSSLLKELLAASPGKRLKLIEPYLKTRQGAIKFCEEIITLLRDSLSQQKDIFQSLRLIKSCRSSLYLLRANINVKLVLENLVLNI